MRSSIRIMVGGDPQCVVVGAKVFVDIGLIVKLTTCELQGGHVSCIRCRSCSMTCKTTHKGHQ